MPSFHYLSHYFFLSNFLMGVAFFGAVHGLGKALLYLLPINYPTPQRQIFATLLGFLGLSLLVQLLSFGHWIMPLTLYFLYVLLFLGLLYTIYPFIIQFVTKKKSNPKNTSINTKWFGLTYRQWLWGCMVGCLVPILIYSVLPSTKIDELFYHQLVAQRIITDGGLFFYRQPWEAAIPPHLLYNFSQVPLVGLGYSDAPNVVSFCLFSLFLWSVYQWMLEEKVPIFWMCVGISLSCLGMYRLVFTSAGSHHFGDLASFTAFYLTLNFSKLTQKQSIRSIISGMGLLLPAILGAKMSLAPYAALLAVAMLFELYKTQQFSFSNLFLLFAPTLIFYSPIVIWTYYQTHSPFGLILSQYFDTQIIDRHLLTSTLQAEVVNTPTFLEHTQAALLHFPHLVLVSILSFGWSRYPLRDKIKMYTIFAVFLLVLYKFDLLYSPRFWGNLPLSFFIANLLSLPNWVLRKTILYLKWSIIASAILPYLGLTYLYLYNLSPLPISLSQRESFYRRYLPLYDDYMKLDKILPPTACLYTQERLNLVHSPRRIFKDSLDVCNCSSIYALEFDSHHLTAHLSMQQKNYKLGKVIYQNSASITTTYRTPNRKPKTDAIKVYELQSDIP